MKVWISAVAALIVVNLLIIGIVRATRDMAERTYTHAAVGDVIMPFRYDCDFSVLYNADGVPMVDLDGLPIECYNIELDNSLYRMTPNPDVLKRHGIDPLTGARG